METKKLKCEFNDGSGEIVNEKFIPKKCNNDAVYVTTPSATKFPKEGNFYLCEKHARYYFPHVRQIKE